MEIMGVNPDNNGSVYADLSNIMCVPLVVVRRQTIQQLVLDQISVICWLSCNLQTADECQEGTLDVRAGGVKSGSETLCFSLDILYSRSAAVHLCQFGIARTDDLKARKPPGGVETGIERRVTHIAKAG